MRLTFMAGEFTRSNDVETSTDIQNASVDMSTSSPWKKFSPLHVNLRDVLLASTTLHPEHVDVRNESYLYANREKLKPKRLMHFITKVSTQRRIVYRYSMLQSLTFEFVGAL